MAVQALFRPLFEAAGLTLTKNYEPYLLTYIPSDTSFQPDSLPMSEIIAHSTKKNLRSVKKAMHMLADRLPYADALRWPAFGMPVDDDYRVDVETFGIHIRYWERGTRRDLFGGLNFVVAFYEVLRLAMPQLTLTAQAVTKQFDVDANSRLKIWLRKGSEIKQMYEVNGTFGRKIASTNLHWMAEELVRMGAYGTMREAISAETTIVHALRLGGIPAEHANAIYREFAPNDTRTVAKESATITPIKTPALQPPTALGDSATPDELPQQKRKLSEAVIISADAYNSADPTAIVQSNIDVVNRLRAAHLTLDEIAIDAVRSYFVDYYYSQCRNGGFAQFVYNSRWHKQTIRYIEEGLAAMGATRHAKMFNRFALLVKRLASRRLNIFLQGDFFDDNNEERDFLNEYNHLFFRFTAKEDLTEYNANWLRQLPNLLVLTDDVLEIVILRRSEALPDLEERIEQAQRQRTELPPNIAHQLTDFYKLIAEDDYEGIEAARDIVEAHHLPSLIEHYNSLKSWDQKRAVIDLVQDQDDDSLRPIMLDYLRAPFGRYEAMDLAKATALGFIDEAYDRPAVYYNNRMLLERDVQIVLEGHGLTIDRDDNELAQRLFTAIERGSLIDVQAAIAAGANPSAFVTEGTLTGMSALMLAIQSDRHDITNYLLEQGADIHAKRKNQGQSVLFWAAARGATDLANKLIARGVDVNEADMHGSNPLTTAAGNGNLAMVKLLVEAGADIHHRISDGRKAINLATRNAHLAVVSYLLDMGNSTEEKGRSGTTLLMTAADENLYEMAELLIARGADVNAQRSSLKKRDRKGKLRNGVTPLVYAVRGGYVTMTKLLIASGANVNHHVRQVDGTLRSTLAFATGRRSEQLTQILRDAGAQA